MGYVLRDGLTYCLSGGRTIFLDIKRDRYFGLPDGLDRAFQDTVIGTALTPHSLAPLIDAGILLEIDGATSLQTAALKARPSRDLCNSGRARVLPLTSVRCLVAQCEAIWLKQRNSLEELLAKLADIKSQNMAAAAGIDAGWDDVALSFRRLAPLRPRSDECLVSSIALLLLGATKGLAAHLVIGVHSMPFSAHCWVQTDDVLLNDQLENIEPFDPILVI